MEDKNGGHLCITQSVQKKSRHVFQYWSAVGWNHRICVYTFFDGIFLYTLEQFFYRGFGLSSNFIIIAMYPLYLRVETDLNSFFSSWRMLPAYILFGLVFYWLFTKRYVLFRNKRVNKELAAVAGR